MSDIILPAFLDDHSEATVIAWYFDEGARVQVGDEIVEVMSNEVTYKIVADASGVLKNIQFRAGDVVAYLEKLAEIIVEE